MRKQKKAFSLIEIIVSIMILTIGVFGIYKLINHNMLLVSNSQNKNELYLLKSPFLECIKYNKSDIYNKNINEFFSINFGSDNMGCNLSNYDENYSFSGININNIDYFLYGKLNSTGASIMSVGINIYSSEGYYLTEKFDNFINYNIEY